MMDYSSGLEPVKLLAFGELFYSPAYIIPNWRHSGKMAAEFVGFQGYS